MTDLTVRFGGQTLAVNVGSDNAETIRQRGLAEAAAAAAAVSSATAEAAAGPSYADTVSGLAATSNGQAFAVDNGDGTVTVYLNNAGTAVAQRTLATTAFLASSAGAGAVGTPDGDVQDILDRSTRPFDISKASGLTSFSSALALAITALGGSTGAVAFGTATLGPGTYTATAEILSRSQGLHLRGYGRPAIQASGMSGQHLLRIQDASNPIIEGLAFLGDSAARPASAIYFDDTNGNNITSGTNESLSVRDVNIGRRWGQKAESKGFDVGIRFGGPNGTNNDQPRLDRVNIFDCNTGVSFENAQTIWGLQTSVLVDTCGTGVSMGSSSHWVNFQANRNTVVDFYAYRNTTHKISGFYAENSKLLFSVDQGASLTIDHGKALLTALMTGNYWGSATNAARLKINDLVVDPGATSGKILLVQSSSVRTYLDVQQGSFPNGTLRSGYEINAPSNTSGVTFNVEQGDFRIRGRIDGSKTHDFASLSAGSSELVSQAQSSVAGITAGIPMLVSHSIWSSGFILSGNAYGSNLWFARMSNIDGATADISSGKLRNRRIRDREIKARKSGITGFSASLAANRSQELTVAIPCRARDFVHWSVDGDARFGQHCAYVSADDTAKLHLLNAAATALNESARSFTVYVIRDDVFDYLGAELIAVPTIATGASWTKQVSFPGVEPGDWVMLAGDFGGRGGWIQVDATGSARVTFTNGTGADIPAGNVSVRFGAIVALG